MPTGAVHPNNANGGSRACANSLPAHVRGEQGPESIPPQPHGLVADIDAALEQQVLDVAQEGGKRTYIITTRRITSGEELKYRNGL
jgi:hypothetical protein